MSLSMEVSVQAGVQVDLITRTKGENEFFIALFNHGPSPAKLHWTAVGGQNSQDLVLQPQTAQAFKTDAIDISVAAAERFAKIDFQVSPP